MDHTLQESKRQAPTTHQTPRKVMNDQQQPPAEDLQRTASVSQRARKASTSQSDSVKRGRIRVIRTKLPIDFFPKASEAAQATQKMIEKLETPNFTRKQPQIQSSRIPASLNSLVADMVMQPQLDTEDCKQQTANFFYFSSSQSTCDVEDSGQKQNLLTSKKSPTINLNRRNSQSKAEYYRLEEKIPAARPKGETLEMRSPEPLSKEFKLDLGCTFSRDIKKHYSTPQSPNHYKPMEKFDIFAALSKEFLATSGNQKVLNSQRPRLIRERFASKQLHQAEDKQSNLWKEPMVPGKNVQLPPIHRS